MIKQTTIKTIPPSKLRRFEIEDYTRRGYRVYIMRAANMDYTCDVLFHRFFRDCFYIGNMLFVKDRKHDES